MAGTSSLAAGLVLLAVSRASGAPMPTLSQWKSAGVAAAALLVVGNGGVTWGEQRVPSGVTALILATEPAWMALMDWLFFKGRRPTRGVFAGIALGLAGMTLLVWDGFRAAQGFSLFDAGCIFAAALGWSWGSLYCRGADLPKSSFLSIAMPLVAGGTALTLIGLTAGEGARLDLAALPREAVLSFLYITFVSYGLTYAAYYWLLKHVDTARVSTYAYVNPVVAVTLGALLAGEAFTPWTLAGGAVVLASVVLVLRSSNPTERPA